MQIRDRIKELRRVRAADLRPNPRNWRMHPSAQQDALRGLLAEVGYADALLARELPDGSLMLVDGHLRAETTPEAVVPVLVLDVDEQEADKILLTLDPLAGMATSANEQLRSLLGDVQTESVAVPSLLDGLEREYADAKELDLQPTDRPEVNVPESYQVVVECRDVEDQQNIFERMRLRGIPMPSFDVVVECPVHDSFRVQQVAGMFDVPLAAKATERFAVELPTEENDWQIGLFVGPSGSGKSTIARRAFGAAPGSAGGLYTGSEWPDDRAVVDCFGPSRASGSNDELPVRNVVELFTAVGFGSPPSWIKPYHVLSCGERFRCDLARALGMAFKTPGGAGGCRADSSVDVATDSRMSAPGFAGGLPLVVFDEFTSVVDRTVAKVCSAAIAKGIRRGHLPCRFVAVTCHYDVAEWLEPDWVLDMATQQLMRSAPGSAGGRFRRPTIELEIHRCRVAAWELFKRHHYLSAGLAPQARCYLVTWEGTPVNFCATLPVITKRNHRRFTRIVTLPDYQGLGIGMRAVAAVAELHRAEGLRINVTSSHPALIRHCRRSPLWKAVNVRKTGSRPSSNPKFARYSGSAGRAVVSFEYIGPNNSQ